ncbi:hypothetical protein DBZ36_12220 [Alginatibacterium sediminis]|uniref:Uncharacterized protein n=1 Tax=Alginatibacterium sediminis TaxID=2164068 RepID=A0A420EBF0_9ALTE|nr:hypothetical protein [Alginatibacterium sediminis]RKF18005.1 hypothetical protein DBZ36_12220 [Alginatibacterium sediminis]
MLSRKNHVRINRMLRKHLYSFNAPRWSELRAIGQSKLAKSTSIWVFVIPFMAKLIGESKDLEISLGGKAFVFELGLPFNWQLLLYSSLFFLIGTLTYLCFCPYLIQKYKNYPDFKSNGKASRTIISNFERLILSKKDYRHISECKSDKALEVFICDYVENGKQLIDGRNLLNKHVVGDVLFKAKIKHDSMQEAFNYIYNFSEDLSLVARQAIFIFYGLGFLGLLIILLQNIVYVINA